MTPTYSCPMRALHSATHEPADIVVRVRHQVDRQHGIGSQHGIGNARA